MKTNIIFILCFVAITHTIVAQTFPEAKLPNHVPPSPQAAQFARYGEIPVGHTTGIPQIEIPIYTLSTGKIDLPISISYHASGFQVNEIASTVGLGWVLNAGGLIMRSIEGNPDYKSGKQALYNSPVKSRDEFDLVKNGRKLIYTTNANMNDKSNVMAWETFFTGKNPVYDIRSDRYNYNFLGYSGVARYDVYDTNMELKTMPYEPLKFTYFPANEKYQVIDSKGVIYEFAQLEYINPAGIRPEVTGWYLTKIVYPGLENDPVSFTYQQGQTYSLASDQQISRYVRNSSWPNAGSVMQGMTDNGVHTSFSKTTNVYQSPLIKTITWRNQVITFNYASDRTDRRKERLSSIQVKHGSNTIKTVVFNNNSYFGTTSKNKRLRLESVLFQESGEMYSFTYNNSPTSLPEYTDQATTGRFTEDYWGYWNGKNSNNLIPAVVESKWRSSISPHTLPSADRTAVESYTKSCVLQSITYPTKGKTVFEYEINRAANASSFNVNRPSSEQNIVGGLRLKRRTNYSDANTVTDVKEYEYTGNCSVVLTYSLDIYFLYTTTYMDFYTYNIGYTPQKDCFPYMVTTFVSTPFTSLSGRNLTPVFYHSVKEYDGTPANNNGWTIYSYTQGNKDSSGCYFDGPQMPRALIETLDCDHGTIRGYLTARTEYNKNGTIVHKLTNSYRNGSHIFPTGIRITEGVETDESWQSIADWRPEAYQQYIITNLIAKSTYGYQDSHLLTRTVDSYYENGLVKYEEETNYEYDSDDSGRPRLYTPRSVAKTSSTGEIYTQTTIFPYHASYKTKSPYSAMNTKNMLDYPVEQKTHIGSDTLNNVYTKYQQITGNLILPKATLFSRGNGTAAEERIVIHNYDSRGNPVYVTKDDGEKVVYLWSYNYLYPVIQVQGATYAEVKTALNYTDTQCESLAAQVTPAASTITQLSTTLRNNLANAVSVTSYTYKPLVGILTETDPRGVVTYHDYDSAGRLKEIYQGTGTAKKVLQRYEYNLRTN